MSWFVESAKKYKLKGRSLEELCDHNASVARDLERHQVFFLFESVLLWLLEKDFCYLMRAGFHKFCMKHMGHLLICLSKVLVLIFFAMGKMLLDELSCMLIALVSSYFLGDR